MPYDPVSDDLITIDDSISRELPIHELYIEDWGLDGQSVYPPYTARGLPTMAGLMIGPKSQVDRVWVVVTLLKRATVPGPGGDYVPYNFTRLVSVGNPIFFPIQSDRGVGAPPVISSIRILSAAAGSAPWPDGPAGVTAPPARGDGGVTVPETYVLASGVGGAIAFPPATANQGPVLQLYCLLVPPLIALPQKRAPMHGSTFAVIGSGSTETMLVAIPTYGRQSIYLQQYVSAGADLDVGVRVAGLQFNGVRNPTSAPQETTLQTAASGVTVAASWRGSLKCAGYDWILAYYTRSSGTGQFNINWVATDECCADNTVIHAAPS